MKTIISFAYICGIIGGYALGLMAGYVSTVGGHAKFYFIVPSVGAVVLYFVGSYFLKKLVGDKEDE